MDGIYLCLINKLFLKKGEKSLLILSLLSVASGFGNALVIFTINMSIKSSNNMKLKPLIYLICCFIYLGCINIYALLLAVLISSIYYLVCRYANKIGEEARGLQSLFLKFINDLIGVFKEVSLNKNKKHEFQDDMENTCDKYRIKRGKSSLTFANMFVIGELLFTLAIGTIALIFPLILNNLESTSVASYVFILLYMTAPVHGILDTIPNAIEVRISLKKINLSIYLMNGQQIKILRLGCFSIIRYFRTLKKEESVL